MIVARTKFLLTDLGWSLLLKNNSYLNQDIFEQSDFKPAKFCGEYINPGGDLVSIIKQGRELYAYFNGREKYTLSWLVANDWTIAVPGYLFRFIEEDGQITSLLVKGETAQSYDKIK